MIKGRVSVIIPGCNERFMQATIDSVLGGAHGDVEVFAVMDGGPRQAFTPDPRVRALYAPDQSEWPTLYRDGGDVYVGMRNITNHVVPIATGEFVMKCDAHCIFAPGWDVALKAECADDWLVVPSRHAIDGETWTVVGRGGSRLDLEFGGVNYHYLTFPYAKSMYGYGLHGKEFSRHLNRQLNVETQDRPIDDLLSFQGSCWFTTKANFERLGPLDQANYNFYAESIELGLRQWMSGGRVVINKSTWYAHLHKGHNNLHTVNGRVGRGFMLSQHGKRRSEAFATDYWMNNRMPGAARTFEWLIDHFSGLLGRMPAHEKWPSDWNDPKYRFDFLNRPADQIPAHI